MDFSKQLIENNVFYKKKTIIFDVNLNRGKYKYIVCSDNTYTIIESVQVISK